MGMGDMLPDDRGWAFHLGLLIGGLIIAIYNLFYDKLNFNQLRRLWKAKKQEDTNDVT